MVKYVASLFVSPHSLTCIVEIYVAVLHCTPMFDVILYQPEIPPNTGNIIRLCANTGATLHLVHPLGFAWDSAKLRRAGLDYYEWVPVQHHTSLPACREAAALPRLLAFSTKGTCAYHDMAYKQG